MRSTRDELLGSLADLDNFVRSIVDLDNVVKSIDPANKVLADTMRPYLTVRRRLDSAAFVVTLYAIFEKFVEDLAWSYAELASSSTRYDDLPDKLKEKHLHKSAELVAHRRVGEGRYAEITATDIVGNLHGCLSGREPYKLNRHAVVHHDTNLRADGVEQLFGAVGVTKVNDTVRASEPFLGWFAETTAQTDPRPQMVPLTTLELRLQDIVDRRNQLSHASRDPAQSLSVDDMIERSAFLKAYGGSLFTVIAGAHLDRQYVTRGSGGSTDLGVILEGPFREGTVVVVSKPSCRVSVGQALFGKRSDHVDRWGTIQELLVDDHKVEHVDAGATVTTVGLRVDFRVTKSTRLFVLESKDDAVWG